MGRWLVASVLVVLALSAQGAWAQGAPAAASVRICVDPSIVKLHPQVMLNGRDQVSLDATGCARLSLIGPGPEPISAQYLRVTYQQPNPGMTFVFPLPIPVGRRPTPVAIEVPVAQYRFPLQDSFSVALGPLRPHRCEEGQGAGVPAPSPGMSVDEALNSLNEWVAIYEDCVARHPNQPGLFVHPLYMFMLANLILTQRYDPAFADASVLRPSFNQLETTVNPCSDVHLRDNNQDCKQIRAISYFIHYRNLLYYYSLSKSLAYTSEPSIHVTPDEFGARFAALDLAKAAMNDCQHAGLQLRECGAEILPGWLESLTERNCEQMVARRLERDMDHCPPQQPAHGGGPH
jgi:hypothetical protein